MIRRSIRVATRTGLAVMVASALLRVTNANGQDFAAAPFAWQNDSVSLRGTLYLPRSPGPHPAAVFIHGSGTLTRSAPIYREHAERLARTGVAMLVYDKRGTGASSGDWRQATFADLAEDALAAVRTLRRDRRIDAGRIGLFGASQGGWIALLAASRDSGIAFIVTLSGPTITPVEQGQFIVEAALRARGHNESEIREALALADQVDEVYRTDTGWDEARAAVEAARSKPWFADARLGIQERDSWNWRWYRDLPFDFDPMPLLGALNLPLLAAHGERDGLVPATRSATAIDSLAAAGKRYASVVFPAVGHVLHTVTGAPSRSWKAPTAYWRTLTDWLRDNGVLR